MLNRLNIGRALVVIGLIIGLESLRMTFVHIGDPLFTISTDHPGGTFHSWYHVLREGVGDVGAIVALLMIMFAPANARSPWLWWIGLAIMIGYFSPFWIGMPFIEELRAPNIGAEVRHILQAAMAVIGLIIAKPNYKNTTGYEGT